MRLSFRDSGKTGWNFEYVNERWDMRGLWFDRWVEWNGRGYDGRDFGGYLTIG
jgi:hypothetical protein